MRSDSFYVRPSYNSAAVKGTHKPAKAGMVPNEAASWIRRAWFGRRRVVGGGVHALEAGFLALAL